MPEAGVDKPVLHFFILLLHKLEKAFIFLKEITDLPISIFVLNMTFDIKFN